MVPCPWVAHGPDLQLITSDFTLRIWGRDFSILFAINCDQCNGSGSKFYFFTWKLFSMPPGLWCRLKCTENRNSLMEHDKGTVFGSKSLSFTEQSSSGIRGENLQNEAHLAILKGREVVSSHKLYVPLCQDAVKAGMFPAISFALLQWFGKLCGSFT